MENAIVEKTPTTYTDENITAGTNVVTKVTFFFRGRVFCNLQYKCQNVCSCYEIS